MSGCGLNQNEIAKVHESMVGFHHALNNADYSNIIQSSDVEYKKSSQQDDLSVPFRKVHEKYGNILDSQTVGHDVHNYIGAHKVTLHQKTTFEKGVMFEDLTYMIRDHEPYLLHYEVKPIATP